MPAIPAPQITASAVSGVMGATLPRMPGVYDRGVVSMHVRANARQRLREIARRAMIERGLEPEFSPAARAEAQALTAQADGGDRTIRDARDLLWCSIDNDDSRDLDQLTVAVDAGGASRVLVAVADVDAGVPKGSALDTHASTNTTSVYTAAEVFPMLPERLSTDLTSLNAAENRLALVVDMSVDADGAVAAGEIYRARVRNRAKLAYNAVAAWLEGHGPLPPAAAAGPLGGPPAGARGGGAPLARRGRARRVSARPPRGGSRALSGPLARRGEAPRQGRVRAGAVGPGARRPLRARRA